MCCNLAKYRAVYTSHDIQHWTYVHGGPSTADARLNYLGGLEDYKYCAEHTDEYTSRIFVENTGNISQTYIVGGAN